MKGVEKAKEMRNILERLMAKIPGFKGFMERETRREVDALERQVMAGALSDIRADLLQQLESGGLEGLQVIGEAEKAIDGLAQEVRYADYGYTGFFDVAKIYEAQLDQVYAFDLDFFTKIEALKALVDSKAEPRSILDKVRELHKLFGKRKTILLQVVEEAKA
jgi:hypothetical protein